MPCDSVERTQVRFLAKSTDMKLLAKGLQAHGYSVQVLATGLRITKYGQSGTYDAKTGQLVLPQSWDSNEFKRAYSEQVVASQAEANGWQVEWRTNEAGNVEAEVTKRV